MATEQIVREHKVQHYMAKQHLILNHMAKMAKKHMANQYANTAFL